MARKERARRTTERAFFSSLLDLVCVSWSVLLKHKANKGDTAAHAQKRHVSGQASPRTRYAVCRTTQKKGRVVGRLMGLVNKGDI